MRHFQIRATLCAGREPRGHGIMQSCSACWSALALWGTALLCVPVLGAGGRGMGGRVQGTGGFWERGTVLQGWGDEGKL